MVGHFGMPLFPPKMQGQYVIDSQQFPEVGNTHDMEA